MRQKFIALCLGVALTGCQNTPQAIDNTNTLEMPRAVPEREYPSIVLAKMRVPAGVQTLTAANKLADQLGIEYVEWAPELNPYDYYQIRAKRVSLDTENPQKAFLDLFDRSGLLPYFDHSNNTVTVYPYSLEERVKTPHIFSPKFDRVDKQVASVIDEHEDDLVNQRRAKEYHYYAGFSIRETINAWAEHASYNGVIWYLQEDKHIKFAQHQLIQNDSSIGATPLDIMNRFLNEEARIKGRTKSPFTLVVDSATNKLVVHPFGRSEPVKVFDIEASSIRRNLKSIADFYGYELDYRTKDYAVKTPYTTVLTSFVESSVKIVAQQYPLDIEVVDSTKQIIVRGHR